MADLFLQRSKSTKLGTASALFFGDESVFVVEDVVREPTIGRLAFCVLRGNFISPE